MKELNLAFYTCFYGSNNNAAFVIPELPSFKHPCFYYTNNKTIFETLKNTDWIGVWDDVQTTEDLVECSYVAKHVRVKTSEYKELQDYDYVCYLDSKLQKVNELFVEDLIAEYFIEKDYVMLLRQHSNIDNCVWAEAFECMLQERYRSQANSIYYYIHSQLSRALSQITEKHATTSLLIKNMKHERSRELEEVWYEHIQSCGIECQISFFFVKQLFEGQIHIFPENPFDFNYKQKMDKHA
jgi:hypothetical protein